jgi:CRP-like cAMP-binding protein
MVDFVKALGPLIMDRRIFYQNDYICRAGEPADAVWLILKGEAVLSGGHTGPVSYAKAPGSLYGDIEVLLDLPYQGNLYVEKPVTVEVARLSPEKMRKAVAEAPPMIQAWCQLNAVRVLKSARMMSFKEKQIGVADRVIEELENRIRLNFAAE